MSAITRSTGQVWKFRPRISMIEQKLQSYVQPREVSTTSTWPAHHRVAAEHPRRAVRQAGRPRSSSLLTCRAGRCARTGRRRRYESPAIAVEGSRPPPARA